MKMFKFKKVASEIMEWQVYGNDLLKVITTYENSYYRVIKEENIVCYEHKHDFPLPNFKVVAKDDEMKLPLLFIQKDFNKDNHYIEISTTKFIDGESVDVVEEYVHKLQIATKTAREIESMLKNDGFRDYPIMFEDVLENKQVGNILDDWNSTYEYEFYQLSDSLFRRVDLQGADEDEVYSLKDIVTFYINQIDGKLGYEEDETDSTYISFTNDLNALKKFREQL